MHLPKLSAHTPAYKAPRRWVGNSNLVHAQKFLRIFSILTFVGETILKKKFFSGFRENGKFARSEISEIGKLENFEKW